MDSDPLKLISILQTADQFRNRLKLALLHQGYTGVMNHQYPEGYQVSVLCI